FDTLRAVSESDAYANLLLPRELRRAGMSGADAALATELTYGTLRRQGTYDAIIADAAGRPPARRTAPVAAANRAARAAASVGAAGPNSNSHSR
ncbi:transcription antitermination protein NusB, partial [Rhizobium johnstonii]